MFPAPYIQIDIYLDLAKSFQHHPMIRTNDHVTSWKTADIQLYLGGFDLPAKYGYGPPGPHTQSLHANSVSITGQILSKLHSIMLYNTENARLKIKFSADLNFAAKLNPSDPPESVVTNFTFETEVFPQILNEVYNNSHYSSVGNGPTASITSGIRQSVTFELRNVSVWIEGIEFDLKYVTQSGGMEGQKMLLETGLGSDLEIIDKDNSSIPCHELVLIAQSLVIRTMLTEDYFVEAKTRQISMDNRSKKEIMAFLTFLYYGDLSPTLTDTSLGVTLYEMGDYYDVKGLTREIKTVLLSRSAKSLDVDGALRLFNIACGSSDLDLKQKAADVLEIRTRDEIFASALFKELSAEVVRELFVMSRRMF